MTGRVANDEQMSSIEPVPASITVHAVFKYLHFL